MRLHQRGWVEMEFRLTRHQAIALQVRNLPFLEVNIRLINEHDRAPFFGQPKPLGELILQLNLIRPNISTCQREKCSPGILRNTF